MDLAVTSPDAVATDRDDPGEAVRVRTGTALPVVHGLSRSAADNASATVPFPGAAAMTLVVGLPLAVHAASLGFASSSAFRAFTASWNPGTPATAPRCCASHHRACKASRSFCAPTESSHAR